MQFFVSFFSNPAVLLGAFAFIGLVLNKEKTSADVITGTFKTIIGFLIFSIGGDVITASLQNINAMFQEGFNITGVIASPEAATALAQGEYGFVVSSVLIFGYIMNLFFARFTRFKNILFHGGHALFTASVLGLIMKYYGYSDLVSIIVGGVILGFLMASLPQLTEPFMSDITGDEDPGFVIGHFNMIGYSLSGYLGKLFSKDKDKTTESIKLPKFLSFFSDFLNGVAVLMLILFYISALAAGKEFTQNLAGTVHWLVFPFIQAFRFTAGMSILMTGVKMFLASLTEAFTSISDKYIPGAKPALDVPTIFQYAPNAVLVGFVVSYTASLLSSFVMSLLGFSVVMIPAAHISFFSGGTAAIFGNSTGGWKGAVLGSFVMGLLLSFLPLLLYPLLAEMGIEGSAFPNVDYNIIGYLLHKILSWIQ
ncbi:PTS ascorbate transporter subunit IIC [Fundicoccus culcitae]|uniref:Ascorbate-specific PTS system EIIC component n=1 Tax=Fundicoccus culcitae TaxID=2969821 RepID=A0ABY5P5K4_9LACT|nr:PTS ascorbate transporter subunit IIC [Fundicoccus culcitae]UUX33755.1 PTS transporter subunit IIC [Fundicoccus culcitae]